jgi:type IV pilus assembly protein PilY1
MFNFQFRTLMLSALLVSTTNAANLDLSPVPLYLGGSVEPNIMFTLDDSGSMHWEFMPEENRRWTIFTFPRPAGVYGGADYTSQVPNFNDNNIHNFFSRSSNNTIFYNPDNTYLPWSNPDGTSMGDATPTAALYNPNTPGVGNLDLTAQQTENACWFSHTTDINSVNGDPCFGNHTYWPITYYNYNGGAVATRANYTRVQITTATPATANFTSPNGTVRTRDEEIQNFANWFQYFRSRVLLARAGVGRAFARQGTNMRVGFATINQGASTIDGVASTSAMIQGVRPFSGADRTTFFNNLYGHVMPAAGTPLRSALDNVGKYFERTDNRGPWSETPGTTSGASHLQCRQSYNILMTDGYWNGANPGVGNSDNTDGTVITGPNNPNFQYIAATANEPYDDVWSNTLADVGMEYWKRDLRPTLSNEVPTNSVDDAFWQHMVTFTVGLGVIGTLDPLTDLPGLAAGTTTWPDPTTSNGATIDDLWHAALNSRGEFFSASQPTAFADRLSEVLSAISDRTSSASSVALNSGTVSGSSKVYQARFDSGDWSGQLFAFPVNANGTLGGLLWDAASLIPAANTRTIITHDGTDGQPFRWGDISAAQQALLGSQAMLDYLRGDQANEADNGGTYRNRNTLLGDIIHSSPTYVGVPELRYPADLGSSSPPKSYSVFKSANSARQHMVYANANDGMLHGFNADTGVEEFAYVPNAIMNDLPDLANINYNHRYYADGSPTVLDAYFDNEWHTVLVSGLRSGGQGIFAIDVTDPGDFSSETTADDQILWEFTDADDSDLGYTFGLPSIVKMQNGTWAAIFSGGYNNTFDDDNDGGITDDSTTGNAVLYIVDIEDGSLIAKFDTKVGSAQDPTGNNKPNGLSTPSVVDIDGDFIADVIYAGDLFGNVWKFDVSDSNSVNWKFSYGTLASPIPLYTACAAATCTATNHQAITTQVQVIRHPSRGGYLVLFGTGKYFEVGDNSTVGQTTQTYYSVWDKAEATLSPFDRSDLLQQDIIKEVIAFSYDLRATTENDMVWYDGSTGDRGWYIDLINTEAGNTNNYGERQVSNSIVRNGRIIFTTLVPSADPCDFGGSGWIMELDLYTGARLPFTPFDLNDDGTFSAADYVNVGDIDGDGIDDIIPMSGKKSKVGIVPTPSITTAAGGDKEFKFTSGSTGTIEVTVENPGPSYQGRQSWRQLDFNY